MAAPCSVRVIDYASRDSDGNALIDAALSKGARLLCGGKVGIAEFTELRWITVQTPPRSETASAIHSIA
jgi:hypothetical protein